MSIATNGAERKKESTSKRVQQERRFQETEKASISVTLVSGKKKRTDIRPQIFTTIVIGPVAASLIPLDVPCGTYWAIVSAEEEERQGRLVPTNPQWESKETSLHPRGVGFRFVLGSSTRCWNERKGYPRRLLQIHEVQIGRDDSSLSSHAVANNTASHRERFVANVKAKFTAGPQKATRKKRAEIRMRAEIWEVTVDPITRVVQRNEMFSTSDWIPLSFRSRKERSPGPRSLSASPLRTSHDQDESSSSSDSSNNSFPLPPHVGEKRSYDAMAQDLEVQDTSSSHTLHSDEEESRAQIAHTFSPHNRTDAKRSPERATEILDSNEPDAPTQSAHVTVVGNSSVKASAPSRKRIKAEVSTSPSLAFPGCSTIPPPIALLSPPWPHTPTEPMIHNVPPGYSNSATSTLPPLRTSAHTAFSPASQFLYSHSNLYFPTPMYPRSHPAFYSLGSKPPLPSISSISSYHHSAFSNVRNGRAPTIPTPSTSSSSSSSAPSATSTSSHPSFVLFHFAPATMFFNSQRFSCSVVTSSLDQFEDIPETFLPQILAHLIAQFGFLRGGGMLGLGGISADEIMMLMHSEGSNCKGIILHDRKGNTVCIEKIQKDVSESIVQQSSWFNVVTSSTLVSATLPPTQTTKDLPPPRVIQQQLEKRQHRHKDCHTGEDEETDEGEKDEVVLVDDERKGRADLRKSSERTDKKTMRPVRIHDLMPDCQCGMEDIPFIDGERVWAYLSSLHAHPL